MSATEPPRGPGLDRRSAIKWMLTAAASAAWFPAASFGAGTPAPAAGAGYGTDPNLLKDYRPGDLWPLTFSERQRRAAAALCDVIIPEDSQSPSASALQVHAFIDEWISAPYPTHGADRRTVLDGLAWLDREARRRFGADFADLVVPQQTAICDDICYAPAAKPGYEKAAQFFRRFRDLTAGGFYTLPEGMKDIGYVGNVPLASFDGPPPEVLRQLGLD